MQRISERKKRLAREMTGLPITRLRRYSNRDWLAICERNGSHRHYALDPVTWEWEEEEHPIHWSSCPREVKA